MNQNAAPWDRALRAAAGVAMGVAAFVAPFSELVRIPLLGGGALYLLGTALAGTCLGYKLIGISTCPVTQKPS